MNVFDRVSFLDKLLFTKHLAVMIKAGIPLVEAIEILRDQTQSFAFRRILATVYSDVANGQNLSKALAKQPKVFDLLYLSLVEVGEESGNLEKNFEYLAVQLQKSYEFKKKVSGAMLYPAFVILVALVVGGGIAIFILPQMVNLFSSLDVKLPTSTKILIFVANFMKNFGVLALIAAMAGLGVFGGLVNTPLVKPVWDRFLLGLPILGRFLQNSETASFCRNLGLMLQSGLPISRALTVARDATSNMVFKDYVNRVGKAVDKGKTIESELSGKKFPFLPKIVGKMIGVGERTGKLDETLLYLGDFFEEEVDTMAKNFPAILEPVLLVVIAAVVGFIALAIISPIYQFTASIHK